MSAPSEEDPHRARWWVFVGGAALVGHLVGGDLFTWAMIGLGLMLGYSLVEWWADRPAPDRGRTGEHTGDTTEPVDAETE